MPQIIQGLWIGPRLSPMEQLSLSSFLAQGHPYHLYTYDKVEGVPPGTTLMDANEILPESRVFQYSQYQTYSGFSNYFRYKLLLERGGWWCDTDMVCLKPFDFAEEHVFSSELAAGERVVTSGIIKAPIGSAPMAQAWETCDKKDPTKIIWGETGPRLVAQVVEQFGMQAFTRDVQTFCPLPYSEWARVLDPEDLRTDFPHDVYAVHLWNEMWRRDGRDKTLSYHPDCLYERLKARYLPTAVIG